jgi:hypothetical protein
MPLVPLGIGGVLFFAIALICWMNLMVDFVGMFFGWLRAWGRSIRAEVLGLDQEISSRMLRPYDA